jgi:hypothetical protein
MNRENFRKSKRWSLILPEEPGTYPMDVFADWPDSHNSAHYTFLVEVEE